MPRSVHPGGLAAISKRVRPGDILVSLNDQPVEGKTLVEVHNTIQVFNFYIWRTNVRWNISHKLSLSSSDVKLTYRSLSDDNSLRAGFYRRISQTWPSEYFGEN
jgi:hypothetical protein